MKVNKLEFKKYYQPELFDSEWGNRLYSFEVYRDKLKCQFDFPDREIKEFTGNDITNPVYVDVVEKDALIFNKCDKCEEIDNEYTEDMVYSKVLKSFICRRGHKEGFTQHLRHCGRAELAYFLKIVLEKVEC